MLNGNSIFNKLCCVVTFLNQLRTQAQPKHLQGMDKVKAFVKGTYYFFSTELGHHLPIIQLVSLE